jgi:hypothetical protein
MVTPCGTCSATAGVAVGSHQHTHFNFRVLEEGGDYLLDPWIIFWEAFRPRRPTRGAPVR